MVRPWECNTCRIRSNSWATVTNATTNPITHTISRILTTIAPFLARIAVICAVIVPARLVCRDHCPTLRDDLGHATPDPAGEVFVSLRDSASSAVGTMAPAVEKTISALALPPSDAAQAALVRLFARQLDEAEARDARWERLLGRIERTDEPEAYEALVIARGMLSSRAALDKIGARMQVGLDALRATPRARPLAPPRAPDTSPLGRLRLAAGTEVDGARDGPPQ